MNVVTSTTTNTSTEITEPIALRAALAYAARGWHVFPLAPRSKIPTAGSRGFYEATTNPATLRRLFARFDYNVGVRTGIASGLLILDVDGDDGRASLRRIQADHGNLPRTLVSETGKGWHLWFAIDRPVQSNMGKIGAGLDVRADGGYVVAPPSIHESGRCYRWVNREPLVAVPEWLIGLLVKRPTLPLATTSAPANAGAYARAALDREAEAVAQAAPGRRNAALNSASYSLHQLARDRPA